MTVEDAMREGRALTNNELAIDWVRLQNENHLLQLDLTRERTAHMISVALLIAETCVLIWCLTR